MGFDSFKNKVVVVTSTASGIGAAICRRFAREGAGIRLLDMDEKGVQAAAEKLRAIGTMMTWVSGVMLLMKTNAHRR
jgi:NAD(P)-dependent dehydrogenase (short-subunit alcohol dehydrogenase family)